MKSRAERTKTRGGTAIEANKTMEEDLSKKIEGINRRITVENLNKEIMKWAREQRKRITTRK